MLFRTLGLWDLILPISCPFRYQADQKHFLLAELCLTQRAHVGASPWPLVSSTLPCLWLRSVVVGLCWNLTSLLPIEIPNDINQGQGLLFKHVDLALGIDSSAGGFQIVRIEFSIVRGIIMHWPPLWWILDDQAPALTVRHARKLELFMIHDICLVSRKNHGGCLFSEWYDVRLMEKLH